MRIRMFSKYVDNELVPLELRDANIVVDGTRFFFHSYLHSGLTRAFGCECDRYAAYLRECLAMFKKANLTCYFFFKGVNEHHKMIKKITSTEDQVFIVPILSKKIIIEVLKEMNFEYVVCQYGSKKDAIALAQKLKCPIISFDIEMCFSGVKYIPMNKIQFNESNNTINCSYFLLDHFLQRNNLTAEKIALFIVLTDEKIFPQDFFQNLFKLLAPSSFVFKLKDQNSDYFFNRNSSLLKWLSSNDRKTILRTINKFITFKDRDIFLEEEAKALHLVKRQESDELKGATLLDQSAASDWFAKGVAGEHVAKKYVNLYRDQLYYGVLTRKEETGENVTLLTLDIVKYAYDLLTNFNNDGFRFIYGRLKEMQVGDSYSIKQPEYSAEKCVFENGWGSVRELGLLEHFLCESLRVELRALEWLPAHARLLVAALVYFTRKKPTNTSDEVRCVLLSYVTLNLVFPKADNLPSTDSSMDEDSVTIADCSIAAAIMKGYHTTARSDVERILDRELLRPLEEFQYCLLALTDLNALCGTPLVPPVLHRSYNGTLVYRLLHAMRDASDPTQFFDNLLSPAPTVYAFFNSLVEAYEEIVSF